MKRTIKIRIKVVYGRQRIYPACRESEFLCSLLKRKTFLMEHLQLAQKHGYKVELAEATDQDYLVMQINEGNEK